MFTEHREISYEFKEKKMLFNYYYYDDNDDDDEELQKIPVFVGRQKWIFST